VPRSDIESFQACPCPSSGPCIFGDIGPGRIRQLGEIWERVIYRSGATVVTEGDPARGVYCVCSGRVKLSTTSSDGRTFVVRIAEPGDLLGARVLLSGSPHDLTAESIERTEMRFIKKKEFLDFLSRNADVALKLVQKLSVALNEAYRGQRNLALKGTSYRLVEMLVRLCRTEGEATPRGLKLKIKIGRAHV